MERKKASTTTAPQKLYRSIREVSELLGVKPHVLRYWETQFPALRPRKNRAGNRIYRPTEVELLGRIKTLLYEQRFTIEGARRLLDEERKKGGARTASAAVESAEMFEAVSAADEATPVATAAAPIDAASIPDALAAASAEIAGLHAALAESQAALEEARAQLAARATRDLDRVEALAELRREMEGVLLALREAPAGALLEHAADEHAEAPVEAMAHPAHVRDAREAHAADEEAPVNEGETLLPAPGFA